MVVFLSLGLLAGQALLLLGLASIFLSGSLLFVCAYAASVLFREVMWRIVTYGKGAWAVLLFIVTGALGITEIVVRK